MLKGKEKNLQGIFADFYNKTKDVDLSNYVNSAKGSLGSLSSKLEQRRQKL